MARTIAIFDLDGTISRRDTYLAFLLFYARHHPRRWPGALAAAGVGALFAAGIVGNDGLKQAALRLVLAGAERGEVERWATAFVEREAAALVRPRALARIGEHRRAGDGLLLATASLDIHVEPLARWLGFTHVLSTRVGCTASGRISGVLDGPNLRDLRKLAAVERALAAEAAFVIAYSDHHSDLPLLRWADRGVAVNPTAPLARAALSEGLEVEDWEQP
jgi:phosphatidylglycerophosphatase C